ncbi:hypothetical protein DQ04_10761020 [Trypanosoma grayi]|uniref:hypothetical protein n=1 Tax=Trypanosoma grayi TaxID=71804 RepID=UPI0004F3FAA9|nr:hypothetical protein DQ04_10761020 [Trypanosoma grayi]KEG07142.1 hypothetical protein DQ04_10761020 [Trypanosoma grayi]
MVNTEITRLRALADDATRDYAAKRDAAAKAVTEAERMQLNIAADGNRTEAKWAVAVQARKDAAAAAVAAQEQTSMWADVAKSTAATLASEVRHAANAESATPSGLQLKEAASNSMTAEAKRASAALVMAMIDVAKEKQEEVALLQRVTADAVEESKTAKHDEIEAYIKRLENDLSSKSTEAQSLREKASEAQRSATQALRQAKETVLLTNSSELNNGVDQVLGARKNEAEGRGCCVAL